MKKLCLVTVLAGVLIVLSAHSTQAQFPPGLQSSFGVYQYGKLVGELLSEGTKGAAKYTEHWVLYASYVYPDATNGAFTEIRPNQAAYASAQDFIARVPFPKDARYVKSACSESAKIR
jgi:hypothetical protein